MLIEIPFEMTSEGCTKAREYLKHNANMSDEMDVRMDGFSLVHLANYYMEANKNATHT